MIYSGDTVRLKVNFQAFDNQAVNPVNVTLTIYDTTETQIEQFILDDTNKEDVGVYFYDYVTPNDKQEVVFEFRGVYNNKPTVVRDSLQIKFI
ncbi:hypothetical protein [Oceanobacillus massiliensis]|uniref:hypothetical protein n=1 Tax=Oceanobacillus massiliensis TaxID=1465765 RepID=UPI000288601C|nr:hypothetical protein [Oceanobacillus massiliensis]